MNNRPTVHLIRYQELLAELAYSSDKLQNAGLVLIGSNEDHCTEMALSLDGIKPTALLFFQGSEIMIKMMDSITEQYQSCSLEYAYKMISHIYQTKGEIYVVDSTPELSPPSSMAKYISGKLRMDHL